MIEGMQLLSHFSQFFYCVCWSMLSRESWGSAHFYWKCGYFHVIMCKDCGSYWFTFENNKRFLQSLDPLDSIHISVISFDLRTTSGTPSLPWQHALNKKFNLSGDLSFWRCINHLLSEFLCTTIQRSYSHGDSLWGDEWSDELAMPF